jgi:hypothetical protein
VFFSRYLSLGINEFSEFIEEEIMENEFLNSVISNEQQFFKNARQTLFLKPEECKTKTLAKRLAIFAKDDE